MQMLEKWLDRVYADNDIGRSIGTSLAGIVGLIAYLVTDDWVVAGFSAIIVFPLFRLLATAFENSLKIRSAKKKVQENNLDEYKKLTSDEKFVISKFIEAGGFVLTWRHVNSVGVPGPAMESLINRGLITTSVTADGLTETFVLDSEMFRIAGEEEMEQP